MTQGVECSEYRIARPHAPKRSSFFGLWAQGIELEEGEADGQLTTQAQGGTCF